MTVRILINNEEKLTASNNVQQLATELNLPNRGVALAINNKIIPRATWEGTSLSEGDNVTIIKAAFGG